MEKTNPFYYIRQIDYMINNGRTTQEIKDFIYNITEGFSQDRMNISEELKKLQKQIGQEEQGHIDYMIKQNNNRQQERTQDQNEKRFYDILNQDQIDDFFIYTKDYYKITWKNFYNRENFTTKEKIGDMIENIRGEYEQEREKEYWQLRREEILDEYSEKKEIFETIRNTIREHIRK